MNERMRELALRSGAEFFTDRDPRLNETVVYFTPEEMEKFAELIVKECAKVCLAQRDPSNLNYKPSERFAEAVKQHFGVEE